MMNLYIPMSLGCLCTRGKGLLLEDEATVSKLQMSLLFERNKREEAEIQVLRLQPEVMYLKKDLRMRNFVWAQNFIKRIFEQLLPYLQITWMRHQELSQVMQRQ